MDFKLFEGLIARRFRSLSERTLSPLQYVAGKDKNIQHGISRARDAIIAANSTGLECGNGDYDFVSALNFLVLDWVWMALQSKVVSEESLERLK